MYLLQPVVPGSIRVLYADNTPNYFYKLPTKLVFKLESRIISKSAERQSKIKTAPKTLSWSIKWFLKSSQSAKCSWCCFYFGLFFCWLWKKSLLRFEPRVKQTSLAWNSPYIFCVKKPQAPSKRQKVKREKDVFWRVGDLDRLVRNAVNTVH